MTRGKRKTARSSSDSRRKHNEDLLTRESESEIARVQAEAASELEAEDGVSDTQALLDEENKAEVAREQPQLMTLPVDEVEALKKENEEACDKLLRLRAEFDNFRKRNEKEMRAFRKYAAENVITEMLPVFDSFERAIEHVPDDVNEGFLDGIAIILKQLCDALAKVGVRPIVAVGQPFDPHYHEAMLSVESDEYPEGIVTEEIQKGYLLFDKVVRHSRVVVSSGASDEARDEEATP